MLTVKSLLLKVTHNLGTESRGFELILTLKNAPGELAFMVPESTMQATGESGQ